ncbi:MAG: hypothetical protein KC635_02350 [Myxococcales bacterium]|nr:hypothetical protein [Myxococcales bacterium]MCB9731531.1 hypothetical protein [Deltaproteobacteria bacterium]
MRRHLPSLAAFALALLGAGLAPPAARAADLPPLLDDPGAPTRLEPVDDGGLGVVKKEEPKEPEPEPTPAREWTLASLHSRYVTVPGFLLDLLFDSHPSYQNVSFGLGYEWGSRDDTLWVVELDWTPLTPDPGNWLTAGDPPAGASYADSGLQLISIDASYRKYVNLADWFHWFIGGGIGLGFLVGNVDMAEVLPTCTEPVERCAHWRVATSEKADLPTRVIPILHLTTGFQVDFGDSGMVRLEAGLRDVLYVGLTAGLAL